MWLPLKTLPSFCSRGRPCATPGLCQALSRQRQPASQTSARRLLHSKHLPPCLHVSAHLPNMGLWGAGPSIDPEALPHCQPRMLLSRGSWAPLCPRGRLARSRLPNLCALLAGDFLLFNLVRVLLCGFLFGGGGGGGQLGRLPTNRHARTGLRQAGIGWARDAATGPQVSSAPMMQCCSSRARESLVSRGLGGWLEHCSTQSSWGRTQGSRAPRGQAAAQSPRRSPLLRAAPD